MLYYNIKNNIEELITELQILEDEYLKCVGTNINRSPSSKDEALTSKESYYYWIRANYNKLSNEIETKDLPKTSAYLLLLNRTCFRGLYREGPNGFNVPFGNYKNPKILDRESLHAISNLMNNVIFHIGSFETTLKDIKSGDFAYLDPPYAPENSKSFVGYVANGFNSQKHDALFNLCRTYQQTNIKFLLSNSDVEQVKSTFGTDKFNTKIIKCKRRINSKKPDAVTNEVLITPNL